MKLGRRRAATGIAVIGLTIVGLGDDDAALIPLWKEKRGETALLIFVKRCCRSVRAMRKLNCACGWPASAALRRWTASAGSVGRLNVPA